MKGKKKARAKLCFTTRFFFVVVVFFVLVRCSSLPRFSSPSTLKPEPRHALLFGRRRRLAGPRRGRGGCVSCFFELSNLSLPEEKKKQGNASSGARLFFLSLSLTSNLDSPPFSSTPKTNAQLKTSSSPSAVSCLDF